MEAKSNIFTAKNPGLRWIYKLGITIILLLVLYYQLFVFHDFLGLSEEFSTIKPRSIAWILAVIFMMMANWSLETIKWKILIRDFLPLSFLQSLKSVLLGVSLAIITPGRIGEYGGRIIHIPSSKRPMALLANLISSIGQNIINIGLGLILTVFFVHRFYPLERSVFISLILMALTILVMMYFVYFKIEILYPLLKFLPKNKWVIAGEKAIHAISKIDRKTLSVVLFLSLIRYLIYTFQYVILIYYFGVSDDILTSFLGVGAIFFFQSNLPLPAALSVFARGEMAIFLWSLFSTNVLGILAATFTLWSINLVVPALGGMILWWTSTKH